jgi:UDP-glucose 4-epimerase
MSRALITGGAGFIGSHLAARLSRDREVVILDNLRSGHRSNLDGIDCRFVEASILDRDRVREAIAGVTEVYHLAALVSVPESVEKPQECERINIEGLAIVLDEAKRAGARKLCFASSAAVYGDNPTVPKVETMPVEPKSPYADTKARGEGLCARATAQGLETVALRFFNVFGARQDPSSPYAAAVAIFIRNALAGRPLTIFGDGGQTRDFIHVADIASALAFAASTPGLTGVFNAGYGGQTTVLQIAQRILALTGSSSPIVFAPERAGDVRHSRADVGKLKAAGWTPAGSLETGLAQTIAALRA